MGKTIVTPYQYKLDLGEGEGCEEAYQEYLFQYGYEDTNERWVSFVKAWGTFQTVQAMIEKTGHPIQ
jgi:hypothetical protein